MVAWSEWIKFLLLGRVVAMVRRGFARWVAVSSDRSSFDWVGMGSQIWLNVFVRVARRWWRGDNGKARRWWCMCYVGVGLCAGVALLLGSGQNLWHRVYLWDHTRQMLIYV